MKKINYFLLPCAFILLAAVMLSMSACNKTAGSPAEAAINTPTETSIPSFTPTFTSTATLTTGVFVQQAYLRQDAASSQMRVVLKTGSSTGAALTGATVTFNTSTVVPETTPGTYELNLPNRILDSGYALNMNATTSQGNIEASFSGPPTVSMTEPAAGASVPVSAAYNFQWSRNYNPPYPYVFTVSAGNSSYIHVSPAVSATSYNMPAGTIPSGSIFTAKISASIYSNLLNSTPGSTNIEYTNYSSVTFTSVP